MWSILLLQAFLVASSQAVTLQWCQDNVFVENGLWHGPEFEDCQKIVTELEREQEQFLPQSSGHKQVNPRCREKSAVIFLHGLAAKSDTVCQLFAKTALGLHPSKNIVRCPAAPVAPIDIFLPDKLLVQLLVLTSPVNDFSREV